MADPQTLSLVAVAVALGCEAADAVRIAEEVRATGEDDALALTLDVRERAAAVHPGI